MRFGDKNTELSLGQGQLQIDRNFKTLSDNTPFVELLL